MTSRYTPINPAYPSFDYTYAEFTIFCNDDYLLDIVLNKIPIIPNVLISANKPIINSLGIKRIPKISYWSISSENRISSKDLRSHLTWLISEIEIFSKEIQELQNIEGIKMSVQCVWFAFSSGGPVIWPEQMLALSKLNLELSISFYSND